MDLELIPPRTTSIAQPLDVFVHRQVKIFIRRAVNTLRSLRILHPELNLPSPHDRTFNIKLASMIQSQFGADIYAPMMRGSWSLADYFGSHDVDERFDATLKIQFTMSKSHCEDCKIKAPFIQCSVCRSHCCFVCFFLASLEHYHLGATVKQKIDYAAEGWVKGKSNKKRKTNHLLANDENTPCNHQDDCGDEDEEEDFVFDSIASFADD